MPKKKVVLVPLFACSLLLVVGALDHQPRCLSPAAGVSFVAQPIALEARLAALTPAQILASAVAALAPARVPWLDVRIWQKQADEDVSFEADGRLLRGPNQCARLEMTVRRGAETTAVVTVSDGVGLARACNRPGRPAEIMTQRFVKLEKEKMTAEEIDQVLHAHGCGGPYGLLQSLASTLQNLNMVQGTWHGKEVIRLTGSAKENTTGPAAAAPRTCHVFLDAQTLWPCRVEWWACHGPGDPEFLFLQLEFRDPVINQPLGHEDCAREFTYQPE